MTWFVSHRIAAHLPGMVVTLCPFLDFVLVASNTGWWQVLLNGRIVRSSGSTKGNDIEDTQRLAWDAACAFNASQAN